MSIGYDDGYDDVLVSDDDVIVEYDASPNDDGTQVSIRRTVWRKARRVRERDILWQEDCVVLPRADVPAFIKGLADCLAVPTR